MGLVNSTIVIADDLTGANDTALQYFRCGYSSRIVIDLEQDFSALGDVDVWAVSSESRNSDKESAFERVVKSAQKLKTCLGIDNFYKKIDSTLRGRVGVEIVALLDTIKKDAAIVAPAYIEEGRSTIGAYQLLSGIPIERTQCALDPKAPIYDSFIPDILKKDLNSALYDYIGTIGFDVISKGAGPIILKIKELVEKGKKLIVADAMSNTDLEQIALAIQKSEYDILPCGSAGLAASINKVAGANSSARHIEHIPSLSRLIISGSATQLSANQINRLKEEKNVVSFDLTTKDIIEGVKDGLISGISKNLSEGRDVLIHSSFITKELEDESAAELLIDAGIAKDEFPSLITDFLSDLAEEINHTSRFILIVIGGETSYKCAHKIDSRYLEILDSIMPAIPLCIDAYGKIIVTKSGNFGTQSTLVDIINYFDKLKN